MHLLTYNNGEYLRVKENTNLKKKIILIMKLDLTTLITINSMGFISIN